MGPSAHAVPRAPRRARHRPGRTRAGELIRALAGPDAVVRPDQLAAIEALVVDRRRALVVQRTGWGKSAVYFLATALLRERGAGPTLVVSPLLALMRDQIAAARRAGIVAETVNSSNTDDWEAIHDRVVGGEVDLLVVSPERLNSPGFRDDVLPRLTAEIGLLVVDEAHCISDWGHDFRPDYRRIRDVLARLGDVPVLACTATANDRVVADVAEQLGTDPVVQRGDLDRASLALSVLDIGPAERLAWLAANLDDLPGSGIVYTLTVAGTELVAGWLQQAGHKVAAYSGATEPAEREHIEQALRANELRAVVATSALGMGFDKGDVGFVVHLGAPPSPIAYYQQVGRAGRAVDRAEVVLLPGAEDRAVWDWFDSTAFPPEGLVRRVLDQLSAAGGETVPTTGARACRQPRPRPPRGPAQGARRRRCGRARAGRVAGHGATLDLRRRALPPGGRLAPRRAAGDGRLRRHRRVPHAVPAHPARRPVRRRRSGRRLRPVRQLHRPRPPTRARTTRPPPATICARSTTPSCPASSGPEGSPSPRATSPRASASPRGGRWPATATAAGRGWWPRSSTRARPVDDELVAGVAAMLKRWPWEVRPAGVTWIPSRTRPETCGRTRPPAGRAGAAGRARRRPPGGGRPPAAGGHGQLGAPARQRVGRVRRRRAPKLDGHAAPILVLDDEWRSGWTMTVIGARLREAGAPAVLPAVLRRR